MRIKKCYSCHETKEISEFYTSGSNKDGSPKYMSKCKTCTRTRTNKHRTDAQRQREKRAKRKDELDTYKETLSCQHCGIPFKGRPEICDFHHLDPSKKEGSIAEMFSLGVKFEKIKEEIDKCTPLCANCHRTVHHKERTDRKSQICEQI
jgi:hypothetical protein